MPYGYRLLMCIWSGGRGGDICQGLLNQFLADGRGVPPKISYKLNTNFVYVVAMVKRDIHGVKRDYMEGKTSGSPNKYYIGGGLEQNIKIEIVGMV